MESKYQVGFRDLLDCGWKAALPTADEPFMSLWQAFGRASEQAGKEGKEVSARALKLFAAVTSMMVKPRSTNTPFAPIFEAGDGRRSSLPEDFVEGDIAALAKACKEIDDPWIRARFADIVWLSKKPREIALINAESL